MKLRQQRKFLFTGLVWIILLQLVTLTSFAQYTKLLDFTGTANGNYPYGSLIYDGTFLYGMTREGGANDMGTIFKIKPDGTGYDNLLDFAGTNGEHPQGSLFSDGTFLYGMTFEGGANDLGTIFKILPDGTGYTKLLDFDGSTYANSPAGTLISDGIFLYGMTPQGGANFFGTIFKIKPDGTGYARLLDFTGGNGGAPSGDLYYDGTFLYGMTSQGGTNGDGVIFRITPGGTGYTTLFDLSSSTTGSDPLGSLISDGTFLYGMTQQGGANDGGIIFKIKPDGTGYTKMLDFNHAITGGAPSGSLLLNGTFLYAMTNIGMSSNAGNIFRIKTNGTSFSPLYEFTGGADGLSPQGSLISVGSTLYGMVTQGGSNNKGTLFHFIPLAPPTISSFTPSSGPVGTTVTITGTNFSGTPSANSVYFGTTQAAVTTATPTQLTVTVPLGATYKPISVSVGGSVTLSQSPFLVTFTGGITIDACTFNPRVEFSTTGVSPGGVVLADFDGDGKEDVGITGGAGNNFSVFRSTSTVGVPSFDPKVNFSTGVFPDGLAVGDIDGDGKQDVVVVNNSAQTVSILRNTSSPGTISFAAKIDAGAILQNARHVAISDIDGDGKLDLAVPNSFTKVSVLKNLSTVGSIAFGAKVDFTVNAASSAPLDVAIKDLDGDDKPDLAVCVAAGTNRVSVLRNTTTTGVINSGSFAPFVQFATGTLPFDLEIEDMDGDFKPDLVTANLGTNTVSIIRNTSTLGVLDAASFAPKIDFNAFASPNSLALDDFDGDGRPDIAVGRTTSTLDLTLLKNTSSSGALSFVTAPSFSTGPIAGGNHYVAAGDIDSDGKADVVLTHQKFSVFLNSTITASPTVGSFTPTNGPIGTTVTITGTNFSPILSRNTVKFNGIFATVTSSTDTEIIATVPLNATPGPITVQVGCNAANTTAGPVDFTVNGDCVTTTERNALIALYNSTNGATNWLNKTNWISAADEDTWFGVTVTGCYVTAIDLGENGLTGFLPSQIGDLTHLTLLHLKENQIGGNIPSRVGDLLNLANLNLSNNVFTSMSNFSASLLDKVNLDFNVNHNLLGFGTLEPNMVFDHFFYDPQNLVYPGDVIPFLPGQTLTIPFSATGTANSYQWYKDGSPIGSPQSTGNYVKVGATAGDFGEYAVEVTNTLVPGLTLPGGPFFVTVDPCDGLPRLAGTLDTTFDPDISSPHQVLAVAAQSTGLVVASISGIGTVRFDSDGALDGTFTTSGQLAVPRELLVQPDDKIIIGTPSGHLLRLNEDGTVDGGFDDVSVDSFFGIALQPDGKIIYSASAESPPLLIRLNSNGDEDPTFAAPEDLPSYAIVVQPDDYILLGGDFPGGVARLDPTGAIDPAFVSELSGDVTDIALQADGKIIVVGNFTDTALRGVARLNSDGTIDNTFLTSGIAGMFQGMYPSNVMLESDGKIIISGRFDAAGGSVRKNLIRLNPDGTVDCTFDPAGGTNSEILDMALDDNERILIAGNFISYDGATRFGLARIDNGAGSSCVPAVERAALVALYNSTNGGAWTNKTNWLNAVEDSWYGVTVSGCHVIAVEVPGNNLVGTIPTELADLSELNYLDLFDNHLSGTIPIEVGSLSNLVGLNISKNQLTGGIPIELGGLGSLQFLELYTNQLTGTIPPELFNATSLAFLRLSDNQLTGSIPVEVGNLPDLFLLDLDRNQLTGSIPAALSNDSHLKYLNLYQNQLSGSIPIELGNLAELEVLDLFINELTGPLPPELANCFNLTDLEVGENQLSGTLPIELGSLANMRVFMVHYNNFTGTVPIEYTAWPAVEEILLSNNQFDVIPVFTASTITKLEVENNLLEFDDIEPNVGLAGYTYSPQPDLPGGTATVNAGSPLTIPFTTSGSANQYQWYKNGVLIPGAISATFSIPSTTVADAGNYTVDITNTLATSLTLHSLPFVVSITPVINITLNIFDQIVCDGGIGTFTVAATGTTNITYQWQYSPDSIFPFIDLTNTGGYSGTTTPSLSINTTGTFGAGRYRCRINGDLAVEVLSYDEGLFINPPPAAPSTSGNSGCAFTSIALTVSGASSGQYRWYTVSTGGTAIPGEVNSIFQTPALSTTTTYFASIYNGTCESVRTSVIATVLPLPTSPTALGAMGCAPSASLTLIATGGSPGEYRWYTVATGGSPLIGETNSSFVTPVLASTTSFYVSINNGICESLRVLVDAQIRSCTPIIAEASAQTPVGSSVSINIALLVTIISDPIDINSIKVIGQPTSGAIATIVAGILEVNYNGVSFAGTDHITIEACDLAGHCAQREITIEVVGDITVYNAISPNGDGKNETFIIQYIDALPETKQNKVTILNRWGTVVFEVANYDNTNNVFRGLSNSGSELPSGTYYYTIEFTSGEPKRTGFLSLRR